MRACWAHSSQFAEFSSKPPGWPDSRYWEMHEILANFVVMAQRYALGALKSVDREGNEDEESSRSVKMILHKGGWVCRIWKAVWSPTTILSKNPSHDNTAQLAQLCSRLHQSFHFRWSWLFLLDGRLEGLRAWARLWVSHSNNTIHYRKSNTRYLQRLKSASRLRRSRMICRVATRTHNSI